MDGPSAQPIETPPDNRTRALEAIAVVLRESLHCDDAIYLDTRIDKFFRRHRPEIDADEFIEALNRNYDLKIGPHRLGLLHGSNAL